MFAEWQYIILFVALAPIFPLAPVVVNRLLGPQRPNPIKQQTYECGIETVGDTWVQFKVQYYIFALIFVIFDLRRYLQSAGARLRFSDFPMHLHICAVRESRGRVLRPFHRA